MDKVVCFGELLLRLSPVLGGEWLRTSSMPAFIGGAELNVATALARWKVPVAYCSAVPDNYFSADICAVLRASGIDTGTMHFSGNRIGIYFLPQGADLKNEAVIYDRAHSSFASLRPGEIDWHSVLDGASWFHFSAISPAINKQTAAICKEALEAAAEKKIRISVDLNYRSKLWQYGESPVTVMHELVQYCDVVMGNIWAAETLLGIPVEKNIVDNGDKSTYLEQAIKTSLAIQERYPKCSTVANTFRFDKGEKGIHYFGALFEKGQQYHSETYYTEKFTDKAGSGDCFMAGLIYGACQQQGPQDKINFATAAAFGKLHEKGDTTTQTVEAVYNNIINHG